MMLSKQIVVCIIIAVICVSSFSGCILNQLFGTSFSWTSWRVADDDGFASVSLMFSCSGTVTLNLYDSAGSFVDEEMFLKGTHEAILHLAPYREPVTPGKYTLHVYDINDQEIFEKTFSFTGSTLSLSSCDQYWWKEKVWSDDYSLIGLHLVGYNNGDVPVYPQMMDVSIDTEIVSGFVLPSTILPGESTAVDCFVYREDASDGSTLAISVKDSFGNMLGNDSFSIEVENAVSTTEFTWTHKGDDYRLTIPYPAFLFDYYSSIDRDQIRHEDYGLYVFDVYDDDYLDLIIDHLMSNFDQGEAIDKINFAASFVQHLEYKLDSETNDSFEYPRYPVETLFNEGGGGDCEDKAILMASILDQIGYDVALFRLTGHMATGVQLDEDATAYEYYTDNYYFLETTNEGSPCGFIPNDYKSRSNLSVYPISSRPLLLHNWKNGTVSIFEQTELGDFVKATVFVKNLGSDTAEDVLVKAAFYTSYGQAFSTETKNISSLGPGMKTKVILLTDIPLGVNTWFKTRIYLDGEVVDEREAASSFP
jgi:hypothetical protein